MTGYTVHTGSNNKFRDGWDRIFKTPAKKTAGTKSAPTKNTAPTNKQKKKS